MAFLAWTLGILGGLCTIAGILTALEQIPTFIRSMEMIGAVGTTTAFLWGLAGLLFLASIAAAVGNKGQEYD